MASKSSSEDSHKNGTKKFQQTVSFQETFGSAENISVENVKVLRRDP